MYFCLAAVISIIVFAKEIIIQTDSKNKVQLRMAALLFSARHHRIRGDAIYAKYRNIFDLI